MGKPNGSFLLAPCRVASPWFKHLKTTAYCGKNFHISSGGLIKSVMPLDDASSSPASLQLSFKSVLCQPIELEQLFVGPYNTNQDERILTVRARRDVRNTHIRFCIVKMSKWLTDTHLPRVTWWKVKVKWLSHIQLFVTPWTVAYQVPLSMGFFQARVLEWVPFPSPRDLPDPGTESGSPALFSSVQLLSRVGLFATPWTTACQASLSITNSWSPSKPMSIVGDAIQPGRHFTVWATREVSWWTQTQFPGF